jgi:hypothetical protein
MNYASLPSVIASDDAVWAEFLAKYTNQHLGLRVFVYDAPPNSGGKLLYDWYNPSYG